MESPEYRKEPERKLVVGEDIGSTVERIEKDAEYLGIGVSVIVEVEGEGTEPDGAPTRRRLIDLNPEAAFHPASTFKLMVAARTIEELRGCPDELLGDPGALDWGDWPKEALIHDGIGIYGREDSPLQGSVRSVTSDMLNGGNMALKVLTGYEDDDIDACNRYCVEKGFASEESPAVKRRGEFGIDICERTPEELLRAMRAMPIVGQESSNALEKSVADALRTSAVRKGTVRGSVITTEDAVGYLRPAATDQTYLQSKTGELNPDEDIGTYLRHDVGRFVLPDGRAVIYVIMTSAPAEPVSPDKLRLFVAKRYIMAIGSSMGREIGMHPREGDWIQRNLSAAAERLIIASRPVKEVK